MDISHLYSNLMWYAWARNAWLSNKLQNISNVNRNIRREFYVFLSSRPFISLRLSLPNGRFRLLDVNKSSCLIFRPYRYVQRENIFAGRNVTVYSIIFFFFFRISSRLCKHRLFANWWNNFWTWIIRQTFNFWINWWNSKRKIL